MVGSARPPAGPSDVKRQTVTAPAVTGDPHTGRPAPVTKSAPVIRIRRCLQVRRHSRPRSARSGTPSNSKKCKGCGENDL